MRILALDLSIARTGWAMRFDDSFITQYGNIPTDKTQSIEARVEKIRSNISNMMEFYRPDTVVIERSFMGMGGDTTRHLCELQGVIKNILHRRGIPLYEPNPSTWKSLTLGDGKNDKKATVEWCRIKGYNPANDDEADAICIALSYGEKLIEVLGRDAREKAEKKRLAVEAKNKKRKGA